MATVLMSTGTVILQNFELLATLMLSKFVAFINLVIMHELDRLPAVKECGGLNIVAVPVYTLVCQSFAI